MSIGLAPGVAKPETTEAPLTSVSRVGFAPETCAAAKAAHKANPKIVELSLTLIRCSFFLTRQIARTGEPCANDKPSLLHSYIALTHWDRAASTSCHSSAPN